MGLQKVALTENPIAVRVSFPYTQFEQWYFVSKTVLTFCKKNLFKLSIDNLQQVFDH